VRIDRENADELLCTTRAVRKRLDLTRPVPRELIVECIGISQQAPTASNSQGWRWIIVTEPARKKALADIYYSIAGAYFPGEIEKLRAEGESQTERVYSAAAYLTDHLHEVPAIVIPCLLGRPPMDSLLSATSFFASIYPAVWSFNLALRARGLGTVLTTFHLAHESEAAKVLGIPEGVTQAALLPVAYTIGEDFARAARPAPETITFFEQWDNGASTEPTKLRLRRDHESDTERLT
jgi:nitroreductase